MSKPDRKIIASLFSALAVATGHWFLHYLGLNVSQVTVATLVFVFLIAYIGMSWGD